MPAKKKASPKKRAVSKKKTTKKPCYSKDVPPEFAFYLCDGGVLKNLKELKAALKNVDDSVFHYHVNSEKNDFANWIRNIVKDVVLARRLQAVSERKASYEVVVKRLKEC